MIDFLEKNVKKYPGKSSLRFNVTEPKNKLKIGMYSMDGTFQMNDELAGWLQGLPELDVQVVTN